MSKTKTETKTNLFADLMTEMKVRITFQEGVLGTKPNNSELMREYIADKAATPEKAAEEIAATAENVDEEVDKGTTIFSRNENDEPVFWDYMIRGFFKGAQGFINKMDIAKLKIPAYKKVIDGIIFVKERMIPIQMVKGTEMGICERPLRAQTPQGERVALARSEEIPAGATMEFTIQCANPKYLNNIKYWLDYGYFNGLGQWRNSGKGKFTWEDITPKKPKIEKKIIKTKKAEKKK